MTQQTHKLTTELIGDREMVMRRAFRAPRELLFQCYADCEHLMNWWGPKEYPLAVCKQDFRPGGTRHLCMRGTNGEEAWSIGVYKEIVEPERIVYTDAFSNAAGDSIPPESFETVTFESQGETTVLQIHTRYDSAEDRQTVIEMGVEQGFNSSLDRLDAHLRELRRLRPNGATG